MGNTMRRGRYGLLLALSGLGIAAEQSKAPEESRAWTVRDSIAVRYFVTSREYPGSLTDAPALIEWSPDRQHVFLIARHGDFHCDCSVYALHVYSAAALKQALRVAAHAGQRAQLSRTITFSSSSSGFDRQGIHEPRWENDRAILFMGVRGGEPRQVYRFDVITGEVTALTKSPYDVRGYDVAGDSIVYSTTRWVEKADLNVYPAVAVESDWLTELITPKKMATELFATYRGGEARSLGTPFWVQGGPWLAPNGQYALGLLTSEQEAVPAGWAGYELNPQKYFHQVGRFVLIDVQNGQMRPALDAPAGHATRVGWQTAPQVLWSPDGARALLINTALPLDEGWEERKNTPYIVELEVGTGKWQIVDKLFAPAQRTGKERPENDTIYVATSANWIRRGDRFQIEITTQPSDGKLAFSTRVYSRQGKRWTSKETMRPADGEPKAPEKSPRLTVMVRESANDPPMPFVYDGKRQLAILNDDGALAGVWRAEVRPVSWREKDGRTITGGLMLPRKFSKATPPPLVIHAYEYLPHLFRPDGIAPTAYAAQPLVARGMAVLFLDIPASDKDKEWRDRVTATVREGPAFVERIEAAVERLVKDGLIDKTRIGLIGFSRAGFMTYYAITHPGAVSLQAAVIADAYAGSYWEAVSDAATSPVWAGSELDTQYDGTFWQNEASWLEHAPGFNVDRVRAPVLFMYHGRESGWGSFETVGAFRINRKPFDFWLFKDGAHQLQRPRELLASIEGSVDWMTFWLSGEESAGEGKTEQYERWRKLKADTKDHRSVSPAD
jgi:dipeptidyl aminopeptidase/acylaminoacyl peptidase